MHPPSRWLSLAAALCYAIALLHAVIIFLDPHAYGYVGAPQLGRAKAAGYAYPDLMSAGLALVFAVFGAYALSGAGRIRRLPLLAVALVLIGAVFTLRGLVLFPQLAQLAAGTGAPPRMAVFSFVSLVTGVAFLAGVRSRRSA
ncbi:hypothetical protein [Longimicrobium sp.]|uniref:hypothetical protein n=1 Tax=Longimicrobium sp. TaxID=2029185 RepID=UPI003B3A6B3A